MVDTIQMSYSISNQNLTMYSGVPQENGFQGRFNTRGRIIMVLMELFLQTTVKKTCIGTVLAAPNINTYIFRPQISET